MAKTLDEAHALLEEMVANNYQWLTKRANTVKIVGVFDVAPLTALKPQVTALPLSKLSEECEQHAHSYSSVLILWWRLFQHRVYEWKPYTS